MELLAQHKDLLSCDFTAYELNEANEETTAVKFEDMFYVGMSYVLHNGALIQDIKETGEFEDSDSLSANEITGVC